MVSSSITRLFGIVVGKIVVGGGVGGIVGVVVLVGSKTGRTFCLICSLSRSRSRFCCSFAARGSGA